MTNLRQARLDDHWRTAFKRKYPLFLQNMEFTEGEVFGETKLTLKPGMNAIVGKNGIGKSNFIRAIYNSLKSDSSNRQKFSKLLDKSKIKFDLIISGENCSLELSPFEKNEIEQDILCLLFDPCTLIPEIQKLFVQQENLNELLESFSPNQLSVDELKLANFITNTEYSSIEVINIEDEYESFPMLPFFSVERGEVRYDSRDMGLGELSLLYYFWIVDYIGKSKSNSLLIIEEPESFLPPLIQNRLCDVLAMTLATKGIACLISTHSEHILRKIPRSHVHIMSRVLNRIRFFNAASNIEQMDVLGLTAPKKGLLFYEDEAALFFARSLIKASPLFVSDSFLYHCSGSEGDVLQDLKRFPVSLDEFSFIAVFDGDCRGKMDDQLMDFENYIFLPSALSPEEHLISYLGGIDIVDVANHIGKPIELMSAAIDVAAGSDHHDYFVDIAKVLSIPYEELFSKLCDLWVGDENNSESVQEFIGKLETLAA
ncbi:ATP-dependent nuclease [Pseudoalteromonas maricaloris]|uniref:AAA family ATPase n=1 Tax=Pseudoalteromonas maricaloris TaxID=184924 RepID=A0A8I2HC17_9GAMM|nr:AAA family ATPase [Pseudoalteromonas maricaloris]NLR22815.1 ATP-binding protein [Pseudoalteromonas maricaloris]WOX27728.1 AAA family ATPase [Pseudoalteromonas maricaloris]